AVPRAELRERYETEFMRALGAIATAKRQVNVLLHILGYFRTQLDDDSRRELLSVLEDYRHGLVPLIVPITLVRHYVRRFDVTYLRGQIYLEPHPKELMLRNHV
ncbi:MAG: YbgA family protein, partial [Terriglobia bacterium]